MNIEIREIKSEIAVATRKENIPSDGMLAKCEYEKILSFIAEHGAKITGAPYLYYTNPNEDYTTFDMEFGIPVDKEIPTSGDFFMSKNFEGKGLIGVHTGSYTTLEETYHKMFAYVEENGVSVTGNTCYDYYLSDPAETPEEELLTQVIFPMA